MGVSGHVGFMAGERCTEALANRLGSALMVRAEFPAVQVIETGGNIGFGRANNLALQSATGKAYCLLNSDAEVQPGALTKAMAALSADPKIGLLGGQLLWPDGRLQTSYGNDPTLAGVFREQTFLEGPTSLLRNKLLRRVLPKGRIRMTDKARVCSPNLPLREDPSAAGKVVDVDQICGAFMLIRPEAWREVGGFDPWYFMYNEDVDLNVRLRRAGWRVVFEPGVHNTHHLGSSSSADLQKRARMVAAYNESRFYYFSRFYGPAAGAKLRTCCLLGAAIRLTGWAVLSVARPSARDKVKLFQEVWRRTAAMKQDFRICRIKADDGGEEYAE